MTIKQKQLILAFFDCLPVSGVDGVWGPQSKAATAKLQEKLDNDNKRLLKKEDSDRITQRALLALLAHGIDGDAETAETVSGLILQGAAVLGYIIAEGLADSAHIAE